MALGLTRSTRGDEGTAKIAKPHPLAVLTGELGLCLSASARALLSRLSCSCRGRQVCEFIDCLSWRTT